MDNAVLSRRKVLSEGCPERWSLAQTFHAAAGAMWPGTGLAAFVAWSCIGGLPLRNKCQGFSRFVKEMTLCIPEPREQATAGGSQGSHDLVQCPLVAPLRCSLGLSQFVSEGGPLKIATLLSECL